MPSFAPSLARAGLALFLAMSSPALSHEFWIEPKEFRTRPNAPIVADLKVGQHFRGSTHPYLSNSFVSFTLFERSGKRPVTGDEGDSPAANIRSTDTGLKIIAYHATAHRLTFDRWDEFVSYVEEEGLADIPEAHKRRGLPASGFSEHYIRCAKALVQVGEAAPLDQDAATGMPLEIIARKNPYDAPAPGELPVTLLWRGKPIPGIQIRTFQDNGMVRETTTRSDADGNAVISLRGGGKFLLNAVHMQEPPHGSEAAWESYWASLTFEVSR